MSPKRLITLVLSVGLAAGVVLAGGCAGSKTATPTRIIENVTPQEAFTLIQNNQTSPEFVILDVRTPEEFAEGHLADATNLDFYADTFRDELNQRDKDKRYLIYCRSGNRSGRTLNIMDELGFREVYNVSGGILRWEAEGLPTVK